MKKKREKYWYIQDWGTYSVQTPIFVGYTISEITKIIARQKWDTQAKAEWAEDHQSAEVAFSKVTGGVWLSKSGHSILYLPKFEDTWGMYETIVHECFHLVINQLGKAKMMLNLSSGVIEEEAMAYQQEYLWKSIRRRLHKAFIK